MSTGKINTYFYYFLAILFIAAGTISLYRLSIKPGLPSQFSEKGIYLSYIEGFQINEDYEAEFFIDRKNIGDKVSITYVKNGDTISENVQLIHYYTDIWFIMVTAITGFIFLLTGIFVLNQSPKAYLSKALFRVLISFGIAILTSPGKYYEFPDFQGYLIMFLHVASYFIGSVSFLHFIYIFPYKKPKYNRKLWISFFFIALFISSALSSHVIYSMMYPTGLSMQVTHVIWNVSQIILLLSMVLGTVMLILKYRKLESQNDRRQMEWIFWGLSFGVMPFVIIWIVPSLFGLQPVNIEVILLLMLNIVPISFAIAVYKYHILDIHVLIKRSIVYSLTSGIIIALFYLIAASSSLFITSATGSSDIYFIMASVIVALIFNPLRIKMQKFVDKRFYRVDYDLRNIITGFNQKIIDSASVNELCNTLCNEIKDNLFPSKVGIVLKSESGEHLRLISHHNFRELEQHFSNMRSFPGNDNLFKNMEIALIIPLTSGNANIYGYILLAEKLSGRNYSQDEIMLLEALASSVVVTLRRLQLQERIITEELELEKLTELNNMKSEFVSGVTHELQTPLTSIKMFAETMLDEKVTNEEKRNNYLKIITAESDRLSRMINNVLDFSRIERNVKKYFFENTDLVRITDFVLNSLEFQIKRTGFNLNYFKQKDIIPIYADSDAVAEAIINIITNSLKYSRDDKVLNVKLYSDDSYGIIEIKDKGPGIKPEEQPFIFNTFFRSKAHTAGTEKGMGIGLSIVKHIMDSHNGQVTLVSEPGKGTCFSLYFPKNK